MAGFDNGTIQGGVFFQAKQFGSIIRGLGPPVPQAGVVGDLYIDVQAWSLFNKRSSDAGGDVDPWGHYLFTIPTMYRTQLKWFSSSAPSDDIGIAGDYCLLWGGYTNYGMQPSIYGPKQATGWPENGNGGTLPIAAAGVGTVLQVGLLDEGPSLPDSSSTQLVVVGLTSEYIIPVPVTAGAGEPVTQLGLQSGPASVAVTINPLYTAEDSHELDATSASARLPAAAPVVAILAADIEVGIDTASAATVCTLPSVAAWTNSNPNGQDLAIFDFTGHAFTNNITFTLNGTDVFTQGISPVIQNNYGEVRLRPILTGGVNQWFVKAVG